MPGEGWSGLFSAAFAQSRNAMALVDGQRCLVDVNGAYLRLADRRRDELIGRPIGTFVVGGPLLTPAQWDAEIADGRADGEAMFTRPDGETVGVQWAATAEVVTGRRLVLFVALNTSRAGPRFRRPEVPATAAPLSPRELDVVRLVAAGGTATEIGDELRLSHHTVRTHVRNAMDKLGARSRAHLVAQALGHGHVLA
ncbi:MAG TPA: PAS and helix-turn-helix domain-containing protein [Solirubrobacteraceae bacterium]|nr:PAS and helix-turn-helix domain-containing protein [Solirubrobacteraceae bacterium]